MFQRARQGALYGAGVKITISAKSSWRNVVKQPLHCVVGFLRCGMEQRNRQQVVGACEMFSRAKAVVVL